MCEAGVLLGHHSAFSMSRCAQDEKFKAGVLTFVLPREECLFPPFNMCPSDFLEDNKAFTQLVLLTLLTVSANSGKQPGGLASWELVSLKAVSLSYPVAKLWLQ